MPTVSPQISEENLTQPQRMVRLLMSFIAARAVYAAAELDIPDHIEACGSTAESVAAQIDVNVSALERIMLALSGIGVLRRDDASRFFLTPLGKTLCRESPGSVRDYTIFVHEFHYKLFERLAMAVRTGKPAVEEAYGAPLYAFLQSNQDKAALFHTGLGNRGRLEALAILDVYDFASCRKVVDVGGGNGAFLSAILTRHPHSTGVLLERSAGIKAARTGLGNALSRCELVEGDYLQAVPLDGDIYVLKRVLFDQADREVVQILRNCRHAMGKNSQLLIIDGLAGKPNEPDLAHLVDLIYLVATTGRTRTKDQYEALLREAGLQLVEVIPTPSDVSVLQAIRA